MRNKLIVGNWKMYGTVKETRKLIFQLAVQWGKRCDGVEVGVCPPFTSLFVARDELKESHLRLGAQNCHHEPKGAFTGEISPEMLSELGCYYVILGHSERRTLFGESDEVVSQKVRAALDWKIEPIVCVGETAAQRESDETEAVLARQLEASLASTMPEDAPHINIAYEPVWAIGTGKTATPLMAQSAHSFIRGQLRKKFGNLADGMTIQYGGSVKPQNAFELFSQPDIDGGLIGGASLDAEAFIDIIEAASSASQR